MPPLPALPLNLTNDEHLAWMGNIQGNIVKGHGRKFTRLLFFRCAKRASNNCDLLSAAVAAKLVTSARDQFRQSHPENDKTPSSQESNDGIPGGHPDAPSPRRNLPFYSLGLTEEFFHRAGLAGRFPPEADAGVFEAGMKERFKRGQGHDVNFPWQKIYHRVPHGVWLLAHAEKPQLETMQTEVKRLLENHGAELFDEHEDGVRWSDDDEGKILREPFGFRDGLSGMDFFAPPEETPEFARIGLDQVVITDGSHAGGSFLVLRKLEQNVKAFLKYESVIKQAFADAEKPLPTNDPGALLVGRERNGTPLAEPTSDLANDFTFDRDPPGVVCPFHAHIRKANPRTNDPSIRDFPHRSALFVRRSAVYDEHEPRVLPSRSAAYYEGRGQISGKVGLLFMGYMANISTQFERMQMRWFNDAGFPSLQPGTQGLKDPVLFGGDAANTPWTWNGVELPAPPRFVTPKGGAYFYVPSISWLNDPVA